ncbi:MAG: four helix bundle protein [Saprospiraceae bacterium]|nr:four helix bundle protein [Saprospiraceae bacterium]
MNHKDLDVWQMSMDFVVELYNITSDFPKEERFGLIDQIRRASVSIPSNIAEGSARGSDKDFTRFLFIALGSATEVETQIILSHRLGFISNQIEDDLLNKIGNIKKMLLVSRQA